MIDDSRKWWKARNWRGHIAHVPHTIVTEISSSGHGNGNGNGAGSTNGGGRESRGSRGASPSEREDWVRRERQGKKGEFRYF